MKIMSKALIIIAVLALLVLSMSLFVVKEGEVGIKTRVSQIVKNDIQPGIHFKWPLVESDIVFDARLQMLDASPEKILTREKKELIVDYFVEWKIVDTKKFWVSTRGNMFSAENIIAQIATDDLRGEFAKRTVNEVVSKDRSQIMSKITQSLSSEIKDQGMEVVDVRVKRVEFSDNIKGNVFTRMKAERKRVSNSLRAQGREQAKGIMAETDKQTQIILAKANEKAEITRGEGAAQATNIYAKAFGKDEQFYRFQKSLSAYESAFKNQGATFISSPDSRFFDYLKSANFNSQ